MSIDAEYPVWALLPKKETGVTSFINKYPTYDGRGVVIGIFDSGVDPGAAGLQVTSDGKTKIIGRFDCSGSGDVDTSTTVSSNNGEITGLSGRILKIPPAWNNPSGVYHIGLKNGYEIFPKTLLERIVKERREKSWDPNFKAALAETNRQLAELNKNHESNKGPLPRADKLNKEDLECQIECLNQVDKKYADEGPTFDCIVFNDGETWCACLDTSEQGDLEKCTLLKDYCKSFQYGSLGDTDLANYSVNIHEDGNLLEIVSVSSGHGTHVASIAAGYFPDDPQKNGVAPGAQIISLTIGDNRIDTMETGVGLVRAMIKVMELKNKGDNPIDVINMSYGEHSHWSCAGRIGELMNEVVDKYGVCWVAAAGNHGPALSTIGTPPNISSDNIIGVGAYVSPEMMAAEYSLRKKAPGMPYTWTSRGPTTDGSRGVLVCAPGGAITSVPQYTLRHAQLLNGTSMASPNAAGAVAVLLSGMKQKELPWSPYSMIQALSNTALYMPNVDHFAQGHGLLQVEKAFDHLVNFCQEINRTVRFHVTCYNGTRKGIHIRSGPCNKVRDFAVTIEPVFANADKIDCRDKLSFQMSLVLNCNASWVSIPPHIEMTNIARTIQIRVDPTALDIGVHTTTIKAYDVKNLEKGAVFNFEVTVIKPYIFEESCTKPIMKYSSLFKPGVIHRGFVLVPEQVTYAVLKLIALDSDKGGNFLIHATQLRPQKSCKTIEFQKVVNLTPQADSMASFKVKGGLIMEFAIGKQWMEEDSCNVEYQIQFFGCKVDSGDSITMHHADGVMALEVLGGRQAEDICPSIQLRHSVQVLRPAESKITPLTSARDIIPPSRHIYQNIMTYNLHVPKPTDVIINCSLLSDLLYENEFESQLWMLYNTHKHLIACGDAYPCKYTVKLEKGDYIIRLQIRHERRDLLEKLSELPMQVQSKLANAISLDIYPSYSQALSFGKKVSGGTIPNGKYRLPLYISPFHSEKSIKSVTVGQYLSGTLSLAKSDLGKKVDTYGFKYILSEPGNKKNTNNSNKPEKTKLEEYQDAIKDLKTSWIAKMDKPEEASKLYNELLKEFPTHVNSHISMMNNLEPDSKRPYPGFEETKETVEIVKQIMELATTACEVVNEEELLAHFGIKADHRTDASTIKVNMERQKNALVEALCKKGAAASRALIYQANANSGDSDFNVTLESIDDIWLNVLKYCEPTDYKTLGYFGLWHAMAHKHYGRALKFAFKLQEEKPQKELEVFTTLAATNLGWNFYAQHISRSMLVRYPLSYRLF